MGGGGRGSHLHFLHFWVSIQNIYNVVFTSLPHPNTLPTYVSFLSTEKNPTLVFKALVPFFQLYFTSFQNLHRLLSVPGILSSLLKSSVLLVCKTSPPSCSRRGFSNLIHSHSAGQPHQACPYLLEKVWPSVLYYLYVCFTCFIRLQVSRGQGKHLSHIN